MREIDLDNAFILKLVLFELATVLSHKENHSIAISIIEAVEESGFMIYDLDKADENTIWKLFKLQTNKNISFIDCANLVVSQKYNAKIASFDKFYSPDLLV